MCDANFYLDPRLQYAAIVRYCFMPWAQAVDNIEDIVVCSSLTDSMLRANRAENEENSDWEGGVVVSEAGLHELKGR